MFKIKINKTAIVLGVTLYNIDQVFVKRDEVRTLASSVSYKGALRMAAGFARAFNTKGRPAVEVVV